MHGLHHCPAHPPTRLSGNPERETLGCLHASQEVTTPITAYLLQKSRGPAHLVPRAALTHFPLKLLLPTHYQNQSSTLDSSCPAGPSPLLSELAQPTKRGKNPRPLRPFCSPVFFACPVPVSPRSLTPWVNLGPGIRSHKLPEHPCLPECLR